MFYAGLSEWGMRTNYQKKDILSNLSNHNNYSKSVYYGWREGSLLWNMMLWINLFYLGVWIYLSILLNNPEMISNILAQSNWLGFLENINPLFARQRSQTYTDAACPLSPAIGDGWTQNGMWFIFSIIDIPKRVFICLAES